jgi:hypothetical protein
VAKKATKSKEYKKVSVEPLIAWMEASKMSMSATAHALGVSGSAISHYIKTGLMPPAFGLAVAHLRQKNSPDHADGVAHFLLTVAGPGNFVVKELRDLEQMTMRGRQYVLIPIN